ncbi:MAG: DMT family transporter [Candidatus Zixiibacteriota bacterium]
MKVTLTFALLCLIWGSTWMGIKIGLTDAPPLSGASVRFALAVVILLAIVRYKRYSLPEGFGPKLRLAYPGLYIYSGSYALIYLAEQYISSALMAVLFASFPLFVAFLSIWILKTERLSLAAWLGLGLGFVGVVVISYNSFQSSQHLFVGTLLALGGALSAAYGSLLQKKHFSGENVFVATAIQMTLGLFPLLILSIVFDQWSNFAVTAASIGSIIYLGIFGTVIAFVAYYWLLSHTEVVNVSLIAFITPVVAILIGILFGESLAFRAIIGAALILVGVVLVIRK